MPRVPSNLPVQPQMGHFVAVMLCGCYNAPSVFPSLDQNACNARRTRNKLLSLLLIPESLLPLKGTMRNDIQGGKRHGGGNKQVAKRGSEASVQCLLVRMSRCAGVLTDVLLPAGFFSEADAP